MEIVEHRTFKKRFKLLPKPAQERFRIRLALFKDDPHDPVLGNHSVERAYPGCRSIAITGDYRAVYRDYGDVALFVAIGTHADLY